MRFFNVVGSKFFSLAFSRLLDRDIKNTLCGTKLKIADLPVRHRDGVYGQPNMSCWCDGLILLRTVLLALQRLKFV